MLSAVEGRVIGSLLEKERTVPDQYPMSLNALVLACNQSSAREPVMNVGEREVEQTLAELKGKGLLRFVHPTSGRGVTKYRQVLDERWGLEPEQSAVLGVLLLRGPQTVAEIRTRAERLHRFDSPEAVERVLTGLAHRDDALTERLDRQPGQSQVRWRQLVADEPEFVMPVVGRGSEARPSVTGELDALRTRVDELEARLAALESLLT